MAQSSRARPLYARLADTDSDDAIPLATRTAAKTMTPRMPATTTSSTTPATKPRRRQRRRQRADTPPPSSSYLPTARRFWADFTLGFADGLTVPFALTAGLSSLGRTDTVVYAGLAEVSAGCISMGIGGYLSARSAPDGAALGGGSGGGGGSADEKDDVPNDVDDDDDCEKYTAATATGPSAATRRCLASLRLPPDLYQRVLAHAAAAAADDSDGTCVCDDDDGYDDYDDYDDDDDSAARGRPPAADPPVWPVAAGLSVALGYLVGGLLPLWPYFFVSRVGDGLRWSFGVCVAALFLFGSIRGFALDGAGTTEAPPMSSSMSSLPLLSRRRMRSIPWRRLWASALEGLQMVILGGIAAIAAVLCVRLFEGANAPES